MYVSLSSRKHFRKQPHGFTNSPLRSTGRWKSCSYLSSGDSSCRRKISVRTVDRRWLDTMYAFLQNIIEVDSRRELRPGLCPELVDSSPPLCASWVGNVFLSSMTQLTSTHSVRRWLCSSPPRILLVSRILLSIICSNVLSQTIVSTILPTISSEFNASQLEYTWVGVSYMLTQTAFQPLYGKLSDLVGRKVCTLVSRFDHRL